MNYGPAYASEILSYLSKSQILENTLMDNHEYSLSGVGFHQTLFALGKIYQWQSTQHQH